MSRLKKPSDARVPRLIHWYRSAMVFDFDVLCLSDLWSFVLDCDLNVVVCILALDQGGICLVDVDFELDISATVDV